MGAGTITLNIFSALGVSSAQPGANIIPGTVANPIVITITNGSVPFVQTLTDATGTGVLTVATVSGTGTITSATINYGTGIVSIVVSGEMCIRDSPILCWLTDLCQPLF